MKVTRFLALSFVCMVALTTSAYAQRRSFGGGGAFHAKSKFGLGLELGEPSGLTGKYFVSSSNAIDFGLGYIYGHYRGGDGLHIYADYLWHPMVLTHADAFDLPFYVGVGGRFWDWGDYGCNRNGVCDYYGTTAFGVRVPLGISFDFNRVPLDIFIQLVPTLDFYRNYRDNVYFQIDLSLGIRFWF